MKIALGERGYELDGYAYDLAIPLRFDGPQPRHFGALPAVTEPMRAHGFVGAVTQGGSCNARVLTLNPHCNGTHTECIGHVTREPVSVHEVAPRLPVAAALVTIDATPANESSETVASPGQPDDRLLTRAALAAALVDVDAQVDALAVRTRPNGPDKMTRDYRDAAAVPYFTLDAAAWLVERGIVHLLVDTPSFDRIHDDGRLAGHRVFWGLPRDSASLADAARPEATITEMIYAPDDVHDGLYLLSLQVAPFALDAAPSRPVLYGLAA